MHTRHMKNCTNRYIKSIFFSGLRFLRRDDSDCLSARHLQGGSDDRPDLRVSHVL